MMILESGGKICSSCSEIKEYDHFYKWSFSKSGYSSACKGCLYKRQQQNKEQRKLSSKRRRATAKQKLLDLFGNKCFDCQQSYPPAVYDFHHIDPTKKDIAVGLLAANKFEDMLQEAEKCVLLCANCHRIRHWHNE